MEVNSKAQGLLLESFSRRNRSYGKDVYKNLRFLGVKTVDFFKVCFSVFNKELRRLRRITDGERSDTVKPVKERYSRFYSIPSFGCGFISQR